MGMMVNSDGDEDDVISAINTTPLVDIMLVLLIIFLITVPVAIHTVPVKLPEEKNTPYETKPIIAKNEKALARLVSHVFTQRRKTLRNSLKGMLVEEGFEKAGVDPMARPETLSLADFVALSDQMVS